jgi:RNA polymerase sigma-70 factor (ECF subfamily)
MPESFESFYRRRYSGLVALAASLTGDWSAAEDVVQDALYAAHRDWERIAAMDYPVGWVRRIVANKSASFVRRRLAEARARTRLGARREPVVELDRGDADFWRLVRTLPRRQAQVVALHYVEDLTVAEIARTLGCAEGSVKASLFKARASIERALTAGKPNGPAQASTAP